MEKPMAERKDPSRFIGLYEGFDAEKYADQDLLIRQGRCPNGHGLMEPTEYGQRCAECGFFCNTHAERETAQ